MRFFSLRIHCLALLVAVLALPGLPAQDEDQEGRRLSAREEAREGVERLADRYHAWLDLSGLPEHVRDTRPDSYRVSKDSAILGREALLERYQDLLLGYRSRLETEGLSGEVLSEKLEGFRSFFEEWKSRVEGSGLSLPEPE